MWILIEVNKKCSSSRVNNKADIDSHMLDYEPLPKFDAQNAPPTIVDPLLQLEIDLKLLREKLGRNDDILEFDYVDSRDVKNENQLGKSSLDLDDGFWSSDDEEYALEEKRHIIEDIVEIEDVYESIHSLFESNVSTSNELDLTLPPCALECLPSPTICCSLKINGSGTDTWPHLSPTCGIYAGE